MNSSIELIRNYTTLIEIQIDGKMIIQTLKSVVLRAPRVSLLSQSLVRRQALSCTASRWSKAYDHDGKTRVSIFNTETDMGLMVTGYSQYGFRLNNNMVLLGPISVFPRSVLSWNVNSFEDITEESLGLFPTLEPKLDVLIIGIGDQSPTAVLSRRIIEFMKKHKINVEVLRTEQACATFNFLNAEGRMVACALIPPLHISYNENDILQSKLKRQQLYETD